MALAAAETHVPAEDWNPGSEGWGGGDFYDHTRANNWDSALLRLQEMEALGDNEFWTEVDRFDTENFTPLFNILDKCPTQPPANAVARRFFEAVKKRKKHTSGPDSFVYLLRKIGPKQMAPLLYLAYMFWASPDNPPDTFDLITEVIDLFPDALGLTDKSGRDISRITVQGMGRGYGHTDNTINSINQAEFLNSAREMQNYLTNEVEPQDEVQKKLYVRLTYYLKLHELSVKYRCYALQCETLMCLKRQMVFPTIVCRTTRTAKNLLSRVFEREVGVIRIILSFVGPNANPHNPDWQVEEILELTREKSELAVVTQTQADTIRELTQSNRSLARSVETLSNVMAGRDVPSKKEERVPVQQPRKKRKN